MDDVLKYIIALAAFGGGYFFKAFLHRILKRKESDSRAYNRIRENWIKRYGR